MDIRVVSIFWLLWIMLLCTSLWTPVFGSSGCIPRSGTAGSQASSTFSFLRNCQHGLPQRLYPALPAAMQEGPSFSITLPTLVIAHCFCYSRPARGSGVHQSHSWFHESSCNGLDLMEFSWDFWKLIFQELSLWATSSPLNHVSFSFFFKIYFYLKNLSLLSLLFFLFQVLCGLCQLCVGTTPWSLFHTL